MTEHTHMCTCTHVHTHTHTHTHTYMLSSLESRVPLSPHSSSDLSNCEVSSSVDFLLIGIMDRKFLNSELSAVLN